jgi:hypothetical protein
MVTIATYSPLRHAALGVWGRYNPSAWFAVFSSYYDASGKEFQGRFLTVAGVVSTARKWGRFEEAWNKKLDEVGVSAVHMKELMYFKGDFDGWDRQDRNAFLDELAPIIKRGIHKAFVTCITADAALEMARRFDFARVRAEGAYLIAAATCTMKVEAWLAEKHPGKPVMHFHEKGENGQGSLQSSPAIGSPVTFLRKIENGKRVRQLEVADLIAWEYRRHVDEIASSDTGQRNYWPSIITLARMVPIEAGYYTLDSIAALCDGMGIPRHQPSQPGPSEP